MAWPSLAGVEDARPLPVGPADIVGARTPCLGGVPGRYLPLLEGRGFRYDSSTARPIVWPRKAGGLWELPLQQIRVASTGRRTLSIDYNIWIAQTCGKEAPAEQLPALRQQALDTYHNLYRAAFVGNRAPISIANHFNDFNGGVYRDALTDFVAEICVRPETRCVSYRELADWLDAQHPETLGRLQALPPGEMTW